MLRRVILDQVIPLPRVPTHLMQRYQVSIITFHLPVECLFFLLKEIEIELLVQLPPSLLVSRRDCSILFGR